MIKWLIDWDNGRKAAAQTRLNGDARVQIAKIDEGAALRRDLIARVEHLEARLSELEAQLAVERKRYLDQCEKTQIVEAQARALQNEIATLKAETIHRLEIEVAALKAQLQVVIMVPDAVHGEAEK